MLSKKFCGGNLRGRLVRAAKRYEKLMNTRLCDFGGDFEEFMDRCASAKIRLDVLTNLSNLEFGEDETKRIVSAASVDFANIPQSQIRRAGRTTLKGC